MKIRYDKFADAIYIFVNETELRKKKVKTVPVTDNIVVDLGPKGELLGVEILNAEESVGKEGLRDLKKVKFDLPIVQYA